MTEINVPRLPKANLVGAAPRLRRRARFGISLVAVMLGLAAEGGAPVRAADAEATVDWVAAPIVAARSGRRVVITVRGTIRDGWHVYGLKQAANGPTPLRVSLDPNAVARADGAASGSSSINAFDPAFGFVTPTHAHAVSLTVPVRLRAGLAPGRQQVPVTIRYQSCDGRICLPPRTVHIAAPVEIVA